MYEELRAIPLGEVMQALGVGGVFRTRKGGNESYGACVFHKPERNNTSFSFDSTGRFHCFSCRVSGRGAIDFVKAYHQIGFQEAVTWLKTMGTVPTPTATPVRNEVTENSPYKASYSKYFVPSTWLEARGLTQTTLDYYGVGEYNNPARKSAYTGCVLLPIRRFKDGEVVGYLARRPSPQDGEPKYVFPKGVSKGLEVFGAWHLKTELLRLHPSAKLRSCFLVESPFCVMKFHQLGLPAVSCYGWSVSPEQTRILECVSSRWVYLPDANLRAQALQIVGQLSEKVWVKTPEYPGSDPEHLTKEQIQALT